jgi:hypothetical protein
MLLTVTREFGAAVNTETRKQTSASQMHLVDVLTRSHARACQVTEEVITLLAAGLADGAMAHWRTLHEIAVVALLVSRGGEELATPFWDHQIIESSRAAREYQKYQKRLDLDSIPNEELLAIEASRRAAGDRFGPDFDSPYGWAAPYVGCARPNFSNLEESIGIDHLRPYYRMASHNVHANPKGLFFKLGLLDEAEILLAGPSNLGLADPGQSTAISLMQTTSALGLLTESLDNTVALLVMSEITVRTQEAFAKVHASLEHEVS